MAQQLLDDQQAIDRMWRLSAIADMRQMLIAFERGQAHSEHVQNQRLVAVSAKLLADFTQFEKAVAQAGR